MEHLQVFQLVQCTTKGCGKYYTLAKDFTEAAKLTEAYLDKAGIGYSGDRKVTKTEVLAESAENFTFTTNKELILPDAAYHKMQESVKLRIEKGGFPLIKATAGSSGYDIKSAEEYTLKVGETYSVSTKLFMEIPMGFEGQVRPRSGLALKKQIQVLNTPGTIDSDYRGELKVILYNGGKEDFAINIGDRIAQLVFCPVSMLSIVSAEDLTETERGAGGFGHSGVK